VTELTITSSAMKIRFVSTVFSDYSIYDA